MQGGWCTQLVVQHDLLLCTLTGLRSRVRMRGGHEATVIVPSLLVTVFRSTLVRAGCKVSRIRHPHRPSFSCACRSNTKRRREVWG